MGIRQFDETFGRMPERGATEETSVFAAACEPEEVGRLLNLDAVAARPQPFPRPAASLEEFCELP